MLLKIYKNNKKEKVEESENEKRKDRKKQFESKSEDYKCRKEGNS